MTIIKPRKSLQGVATIIVVGIGVLAWGAAAAESTDVYDGQWHFGATLYGWFPNINTTLDFPRLGDPSVEVKPSSYLSNLKFGAMGFLQARKGDWGIVTDLVYTDLGSLNSKVLNVRGPGGRVDLPISTTIGADVKTTIWTAAASYTAIRNSSGTLDLIGGLRYGGLKPSVNWNFSGPIGVLSASGSASRTVNLWDGIIGVQGSVRMSEDGKWFMPYEADIGAGSNNWTWNASLGAGYRFDWGDLVFLFRSLSFKQTDDKPVQSMQLTGPALGVTFHW